MERFVQDLKYSLRILGQQRAFAIAAIAALALGIGATTAVFSVVDTILLRPFSFPEPDRLVMFMNKGPNGEGPAASPAKFAHWRQQTRAVVDASAIHPVIVNYTGDVTEQITSEQVNAPFFRLLGARTLLGRTFTAEEDRANGPKVAVLSYGWWTRRFASDPAIIGKTIQLSGDPYVVIGVLNRGFDASELTGSNADLWTPFGIDPNTTNQANYFQGVGRLAPGV